MKVLARAAHPSSGARARARRAGCLALLGLTLAGRASAPAADRRSEPPADSNALTLSNAFFGPHAASDPAAAKNFENRMLNAFTLSPPLASDPGELFARHSASAIFAMPGATRAGDAPGAVIERERRRLASLRAGGLDVLWNLMEEWDQAGGRWVRQGRPRYAGLTRRQAHDAFVRYYLDHSPPLGTYLRQPRQARELPLVAQTDFPMNVFYAFEMGIDAVMLERAIDELGDLSTGIAFARGAASQFGRRWGIDVSLWRTSNESATAFDGRGTLTGGWSPNYVRRHLYVSYLAGARLLQLEPVVYYGDDGALNPLGRAVREFADFALRRHPDVGRPVVSAALMVSYEAGFDPKHWIHCQADAVWYHDIPYSDGDHMLDNLLEVAYPGHRLHGLAPGAPFANAAGAPDPVAFARYLRAGGDPRPFEPMPATRWGDNLDVIADNAPADTLHRYRVIVLVGDVSLDARLRAALRAWVTEGGVLVANASQVTAADEPLLGVRLGAATGAGSRSIWLGEGQTYDEEPFGFTRVVPTTGSVLATDGGGAPLVTSNRIGRGQAVLTTPRFLQTRAKDRLLRIGVRLLDSLFALHAAARVAGPPIEYVVGRASGKTLVTLVNNSGARWSGQVTALSTGAPVAVREYVADVDVASARAGSGGDVVVRAEVPPYDVKVYAFEAR